MSGIVIHSRKVVYWQIPKAACSAIKLHFCDVMGLPIPEDVHNASLYTWTEELIPEYYNFTIVRNPFSRLYSLWKNKVRTSIDANVFDGKDGVHQGMPFDVFVRAIVKIRPAVANLHYAPQSLQVPNGVQAIKMENIYGFMRGIFPVVNASGPGDWHCAYTPELVKLVSDYYAQDFRRFGYSVFPWETILVDCDGVLTDGNLTIDHTGEKLFKRFHTRDVRAIRQLIFHGFHVVLVSADDWSGLFHFADKVGAEVLVSKDKKENGYQNYIAVGDDAWDVPMIERSSLAFVPADADPSVLKCSKGVIKLETPGGRGVMAEVVRILLGY